MSRTDPSHNAAHDFPLADRLVIDRIKQWLDTAIATELAGYGTLDPQEVAARKAVDQVRHLALADYQYALVPKILDDLRRAGLMTPPSDD
ncbi:hypothetical protein OOK29_10120 [Streptomyces phaeochromogenes]|uniref:hypothetical protein n=1 Tax=Streptomyces phaeochromogenes TaxID=1923 RepID=UPI0022570218|nr:hypothetical protein [Streptomyces phaeochromogenes]MCX5598495.1 hypothetical protein [Streptomyces phaeochromogenes]